MILYVLTDELLLPPADFLGRVEEALRGGAGMIQFREKIRSFDESVALGRHLATLCRRYGAPLIVNDSVPLALAIGAAGVHLGKDDAGVEEARRALGSTALIGVSCYADLERARTAQAMGADYVAFGACYPSRTKTTATPVSIATICAACAELRIDVCCIGGIDATNVKPLADAGAEIIAVCAAVFGGTDVYERTRLLINAARAESAQ